jgi:citrate synthase
VLIFRAMGFPTEFFPVLFAIPRMAGWLAHWKESLDDPDTKIMRPQQVSVIKKILSSIVTMSMNLM